METARKVSEDTHVLPSYFPIPGFGLVPVNAFVIKAKEPVLVDTGLHQDHAAFLGELSKVIDPGELRWLWLTHPDQDHVGALMTLMNENPGLRLVTTFLGYGILSLFEQIPLDRIYLVNPGEALDVGDRQLVAYKPPTFDNPATTGFFDTKSRALFSSDCFGALLQNPADEAEAISSDDLRQGQILWTSIDSPCMILSSHLPPSRSLTDIFLTNLAAVPDAPAFVGPNQAGLEAMLAGMTQGSA
jgi:glyoxylase-like metal-dependent hydrolase (beta-lactamase superfamily II)